MGRIVLIIILTAGVLFYGQANYSKGHTDGYFQALADVKDGSVVVKVKP